MKLLTKSSIFYILFAIPVLVACAFISYYLVDGEVKDNLDESMWKDMLKIEAQLDRTDTVAGLTLSGDSDINVKRIVDPENKLVAKYSQPVFTDTVYYDRYEEEELPCRVLHKIYKTKLHLYSIRVRRAMLESDDLADSIIYPVIIMFCCLLSGFFIITLIISRRLWKPFYTTLAMVKEYEIDKGANVRFEGAKTTEFRILNEALNKMTEQVYKDFTSQKLFSENASHEMQTPLAVIKNKIELLIQSKTLSGPDMEIIQSIYNSANKLSQINKALLLLAKIESHQFVETKEIDPGTIVERSLTLFSDMIVMKNISITKNIPKGFLISMNPILADVMINNLVQNSIRHNIQDGELTITLNERGLIISNTGREFNGDPMEMFTRFRKSDQSAESIGLGLAIIKQVCDHHGYKITYEADGGKHTIRIIF